MTQGWVVVHPKRKPLWWMADESRAGSQKSAEEWMQTYMGKRITWKQLYRRGYRCVRCEVVK